MDFRTRFRLPPSPPKKNNPKQGRDCRFRIVFYIHGGNRNRNSPSFASAKGTNNAKDCEAMTEERASVYRRLHQKQIIRNHLFLQRLSDYFFIRAVIENV